MYCIERVTHNVLLIHKVMLPLAGQKSRSLESENDAKTCKQSIFGEITQFMPLECHKEPYNAALWTCKRGM